jgi:DNA-binding transcriptional LysR family regulator
MNQKQLNYFLAIAEEGNITKAAERLHIPQPHLSNQLKNMEIELGVKLAVRNTRRLQLTDAGSRLQYRAAQILELMDVTTNELEEFETGLQGILTIGTIATSAAILLPNVVNIFHQRFPKVRFEIQNMSTKRILESLKIGTIEIGIIRTPIDLELYESINLKNQPMVAATTDHKFLDNHKMIDLIKLSGKPLLVNYRFESIVIEACRNAGFEPNILCKVDDTRTILLWASLGMGIAVIPKDWINIVPGLNLSYREINAASLITSSAVVCMKNRCLSSI